MAAQILARAFVLEAKYAAAFPTFTFERRGAPVTTFFRFDDSPIREKTQVYYPDCMIVIDRRLVRNLNIFDGLKPGGILILNSAEPVQEKFVDNLATIVSVDAIRIGMQELGAPITNTCMLGTFAWATGWIQLDSLFAAVRDSIEDKVAEKNIRCVQRGFDEAVVTRF